MFFYWYLLYDTKTKIYIHYVDNNAFNDIDDQHEY